LYGPVFEELPADPQEKGAVLEEAEERLRFLYKMVVEILTLKEAEERFRQAADV